MDSATVIDSFGIGKIHGERPVGIAETGDIVELGYEGFHIQDVAHRLRSGLESIVDIRLRRPAVPVGILQGCHLQVLHPGNVFDIFLFGSIFVPFELGVGRTQVVGRGSGIAGYAAVGADLKIDYHVESVLHQVGYILPGALAFLVYDPCQIDQGFHRNDVQVALSPAAVKIVLGPGRAGDFQQHRVEGVGLGAHLEDKAAVPGAVEDRLHSISRLVQDGGNQRVDVRTAAFSRRHRLADIGLYGTVAVPSYLRGYEVPGGGDVLLF